MKRVNISLSHKLNIYFTWYNDILFANNLFDTSFIYPDIIYSSGYCMTFIKYCDPYFVANQGHIIL